MGSQWNQSGAVFTSNLNGNNYWSMVMVPQNEEVNLIELSEEYSQYAYVFPQNTEVEWSYDENNSSIQTEFLIDVDVKEGSYNQILQGLLPHQWKNLANDSPNPDGYKESVRGELKTLSGNYFKTENKFIGILPTLPPLNHYSVGYNPGELQNKISQIQNDELPLWTDSYNEGQLMNRLIQTARIAAEIR